MLNNLTHLMGYKKLYLESNYYNINVIINSLSQVDIQSLLYIYVVL